MARERGIIRWYDQDKGFGFIIPDDGSRDIYVKASGIEEVAGHELRDGQRVEFEKILGPKGIEAIHVKHVE